MRCMRGLDVLMTPRMWLAPPPTAVAHYVMYEDKDPSERREPSCEQWYLLDGMKSVGQQRVQYFNDRLMSSDLAKSLGVASYSRIRKKCSFFEAS